MKELLKVLYTAAREKDIITVKLRAKLKSPTQLQTKV